MMAEADADRFIDSFALIPEPYTHACPAAAGENPFQQMRRGCKLE
jgi:hypothetical protein